jgi:hypothetical protein
MLVAPVTPAGAAGPPPPACTPDGNGGCYLFYSATVTDSSTGASDTVQWDVNVNTGEIESVTPSLYLPSGYTGATYFQLEATPSPGPIDGWWEYHDSSQACHTIGIRVYSSGTWTQVYPPC